MPPRRTDNHIPAARIKSLIPSSVMRSIRQFQCAIGIFVTLQAWKVKNILAVYYGTDLELYHGIISKWCLIDACYFVTLHIVNISRLKVTKQKTIFLIAIAFMFNLSVFVVFSGLFVNMIFGNPLGKQTSVPQGISTDVSGEDNMISVNDKYCANYDAPSSTCQPELPTIKISAKPIVSECAGRSEIGTKFIVIFEGAPPYVLYNLITKQNDSSMTVIERDIEYVDRSCHIFYYLPSSSGEYTYDFHSFGDLHHKYLPTQIAPIKQSVHPQPDAKFDFSLRRVLRTCPGEDISIDVDLYGTGPFELSWAHADQIYSDKMEVNMYTIKLIPFGSAGHHVVSLVKIQDANGCVKDLDSPDFIIDVHSNRPTASFDTNGENIHKVEITEGTTTSLPIRLTGERPWFVTYCNVELGDSSKRTERFIDPNSSIRVSAVGHYELLKVDDSTCSGDVLKPQYLVQWLDKPTISIAGDDISTKSYGL